MDTGTSTGAARTHTVENDPRKLKGHSLLAAGALIFVKPPSSGSRRRRGDADNINKP